ncbi:hypothetical protein AB0O67_03695 [Streptomyces sp. NPDC086077]|uniref:hypothetical protein n=1 Tax=Streptomyces sp. NPDC086077 TaxID=3154862 RepID=UPI00342D40D5
MIAAEGRQHDPPPDASEEERDLHRLAVLLAGMAASREALLATAIGCGSLAVLATPEYDRWFAGRLEGVSRAVALAGTTWPFGDL